MSKYSNKITLDSEDIIPKLSEAALQRLTDLLTHATNTDIKLDDLLLAAGKVKKYNYFNGTELDELVQYHLTGENGLNISIMSGDDGTDYEPYVTRYYIDYINIDWKQILYPIRTKLESVLNTAAELEKYQAIYNIDNWYCDYDTLSYDAQFSKAGLNPSILMEVNNIIKHNLKK